MHISSVAKLAYDQNYFEQAASQFANLFENEKALNENFYGVLVTRSLNDDAKAQAFFMLEELTPAFKAYVAPLSAYFKFKKGILSLEEARVTFDEILQTRPPYALWPQVYLSLFCFELHTQTQVSGAQATADLLALQKRLRSLAPVISPDLSSIYGYLELLYVHQLGLQGQSELSPVLPVSLQKHDLRFMQRFQEEHPAFVCLETLLVQGSEPTSEKVENEWCILAAFADPNKGNMAALERALKEEAVAQSWINTLTQTWAPWPYDQVLMRHYPDLVRQGKWTLIDVWGTWCGPCRRQLPAIQRLYAQQAQQLNSDLQIVTLSYKSTDLKHFMQQNAYTFPVEEIEKHENAAMQLKAYPTTWLIAPNGKYVKLSNLETQLPWLQWLQQQ
ncbi:MAG: TlpA disulfide reductase family protein [Sphingobacteriaceae bacterium]|nr:TlpA disulfide reductase family protein [Sphingobacteriaceae bacterium]